MSSVGDNMAELTTALTNFLRRKLPTAEPQTSPGYRALVLAVQEALHARLAASDGHCSTQRMVLQVGTTTTAATISVARVSLAEEWLGVLERATAPTAEGGGSPCQQQMEELFVYIFTLAQSFTVLATQQQQQQSQSSNGSAASQADSSADAVKKHNERVTRKMHELFLAVSEAIFSLEYYSLASSGELAAETVTAGTGDTTLHYAATAATTTTTSAVRQLWFAWVLVCLQHLSARGAADDDVAAWNAFREQCAKQQPAQGAASESAPTVSAAELPIVSRRAAVAAFGSPHVLSPTLFTTLLRRTRFRRTALLFKSFTPHLASQAPSATFLLLNCLEGFAEEWSELWGRVGFGRRGDACSRRRARALANSLLGVNLDDTITDSNGIDSNSSSESESDADETTGDNAMNNGKDEEAAGKGSAEERSAATRALEAELRALPAKYASRLQSVLASSNAHAHLLASVVGSWLCARYVLPASRERTAAAGLSSPTSPASAARGGARRDAMEAYEAEAWLPNRLLSAPHTPEWFWRALHFPPIGLLFSATSWSAAAAAGCADADYEASGSASSAGILRLLQPHLFYFATAEVRIGLSATQHAEGKRKLAVCGLLTRAMTTETSLQVFHAVALAGATTTPASPAAAAAAAAVNPACRCAATALERFTAAMDAFVRGARSQIVMDVGAPRATLPTSNSSPSSSSPGGANGSSITGNDGAELGGQRFCEMVYRQPLPLWAAYLREAHDKGGVVASSSTVKGAGGGGYLASPWCVAACALVMEFLAPRYYSLAVEIIQHLMDPLQLRGDVEGGGGGGGNSASPGAAAGAGKAGTTSEPRSGANVFLIPRRALPGGVNVQYYVYRMVERRLAIWATEDAHAAATATAAIPETAATTTVAVNGASEAKNAAAPRSAPSAPSACHVTAESALRDRVATLEDFFPLLATAQTYVASQHLAVPLLARLQWAVVQAAEAAAPVNAAATAPSRPARRRLHRLRRVLFLSEMYLVQVVFPWLRVLAPSPPLFDRLQSLFAAMSAAAPRVGYGSAPHTFLHIKVWLRHLRPDSAYIPLCRLPALSPSAVRLLRRRSSSSNSHHHDSSPPLSLGGAASTPAPALLPPAVAALLASSEDAANDRFALAAAPRAARRYPHERVRAEELESLLAQCLKRVTADNAERYQALLYPILCGDSLFTAERFFLQCVGYTNNFLDIHVRFLAGLPPPLLYLFWCHGLAVMEQLALRRELDRVSLVASLLAAVWRNSVRPAAAGAGGGVPQGAEGAAAAAATRGGDGSGDNDNDNREAATARWGAVLLRAAEVQLRQRTRSSLILGTELLKAVTHHFLHHRLEKDEKLSHAQRRSAAAPPRTQWLARGSVESFRQTRWVAGRRVGAHAAAARIHVTALGNEAAEEMDAEEGTQDLYPAGAAPGDLTLLDLEAGRRVLRLTLRERIAVPLTRAGDDGDGSDNEEKEGGASRRPDTLVLPLGQHLLLHLCRLRTCIYELQADMDGDMDTILGVTAEDFNTLNDLIFALEELNQPDDEEGRNTASNSHTTTTTATATATAAAAFSEGKADNRTDTTNENDKEENKRNENEEVEEVEENGANGARARAQHTARDTDIPEELLVAAASPALALRLAARQRMRAMARRGGIDADSKLSDNTAINYKTGSNLLAVVPPLVPLAGSDDGNDDDDAGSGASTSRVEAAVGASEHSSSSSAWRRFFAANDYMSPSLFWQLSYFSAGHFRYDAVPYALARSELAACGDKMRRQIEAEMRQRASGLSAPPSLAPGGGPHPRRDRRDRRGGHLYGNNTSGGGGGGAVSAEGAAAAAAKVTARYEASPVTALLRRLEAEVEAERRAHQAAVAAAADARRHLLGMVTREILCSPPLPPATADAADGSEAQDVVGAFALHYLLPRALLSMEETLFVINFLRWLVRETRAAEKSGDGRETSRRSVDLVLATVSACLTVFAGLTGAECARVGVLLRAATQLVGSAAVTGAGRGRLPPLPPAVRDALRRQEEEEEQRERERQQQQQQQAATAAAAEGGDDGSAANAAAAAAAAGGAGRTPGAGGDAHRMSAAQFQQMFLSPSPPSTAVRRPYRSVVDSLASATSSAVPETAAAAGSASRTQQDSAAVGDGNRGNAGDSNSISSSTAGASKEPSGPPSEAVLSRLPLQLEATLCAFFAQYLQAPPHKTRGGARGTAAAAASVSNNGVPEFLKRNALVCIRALMEPSDDADDNDEADILDGDNHSNNNNKNSEEERTGSSRQNEKTTGGQPAGSGSTRGPTAAAEAGPSFPLTQAAATFLLRLVAPYTVDAAASTRGGRRGDSASDTEDDENGGNRQRRGGGDEGGGEGTTIVSSGAGVHGSGGGRGNENYGLAVSVYRPLPPLVKARRDFLSSLSRLIERCATEAGGGAVFAAPAPPPRATTPANVSGDTTIAATTSAAQLQALAVGWFSVWRRREGLVEELLYPRAAAGAGDGGRQRADVTAAAVTTATGGPGGGAGEEEGDDADDVLLGHGGGGSGGGGSGPNRGGGTDEYEEEVEMLLRQQEEQERLQSQRRQQQQQQKSGVTGDHGDGGDDGGVADNDADVSHQDSSRADTDEEEEEEEESGDSSSGGGSESGDGLGSSGSDDDDDDEQPNGEAVAQSESPGQSSRPGQKRGRSGSAGDTSDNDDDQLPRQRRPRHR